MKYISYNDQELLSESYNSINVKQIMLESSVDSFIKNAPNVDTLAEAYAILDIYNDLVEEGLFGGLANVAKGVGGTIARGAQNVASGAQAAGKAVVQGAKTAGQMAGAAANTVGSNIAGMYASGSNAAEAKKIIAQAAEAAQQIIDLVNRAKELDKSVFAGKKQPEQVALGTLKTYLQQVGTNTDQAATAARDKGVFGGVGGAMRQAYQGGAAPAPANP
jgi:hypothetical protein